MAKPKQLVSKRNRFYESETSSSGDDEDPDPPVTRSRASNKGDNPTAPCPPTQDSGRASRFASHVVNKAMEPVPDDMVAAIARNYKKATYSNVMLMNHRGVGCTVDKDDFMSIEDDQWITDGVIDFHNVLLSIRRPTLRDGKTWAAMDCKAYTQTNLHGAPLTLGNGRLLLEHDYLAIPVLESAIKHRNSRKILAGTMLVLSELAKASSPSANMEFVDQTLKEADCCILREDKLPQQPNKEDCGIFVCQYLKTLVNTDFATVLSGLWFQGVTPHQYRREMRRDLCAHASGALLQQLQDMGIEIPPQDEGRVTDEGTVVQLKNAAVGDGRTAPVTRPVEDARVTEVMRRVASLTNDVRYLNATVTVIANFVGLRRDEVMSAATQLLLQGGHPGTGTNAEAGGNKTAPRTPQRPSARKRRADSSPEEDGVRNGTRVALASTFAACAPASSLLPNPLLSQGAIPHWMFTRGRQLLGNGVPPGDAALGDTHGQETLKGEEEEDLVSDSDDDGEDEDTCATTYTGVKLDKRTGKFGVKILIKERGKRKQQRLGAYTTEEEAAFAYAAGAFVLRPRDRIPNTVTLSAAEKAMLRGCTKEDLQILVEARKWWRWRSWRDALESASSRLKGGRKRGGDTDDGTGAESADSSERSEEEDEESEDTSAPGSQEESADQGAGGKTHDDGCAGISAANADRRTHQDARDTDVSRGDGRGQADGLVGRTRVNTLDANGDDVRIPSRILEQLIQAQDKSAKENARLEALFLNAMSRPSGGSGKRKAQKQRDPGQGCMNPKRQRGETWSGGSDGDGEDDDDDTHGSGGRHMRTAKSPILQRALEHLPTDKAWKVSGHVTVGAFFSVRRVGLACGSGDGYRFALISCFVYTVCAQRVCELARVHMFLNRPTSTMTFYPSSDDKTHGVCAVLDRLPHSFACLALAADKSRRADLNKTLSEWKTRAAARVRDIALPKLGLFRDDRDASSPWAPEKARSIDKIRERIGLGADFPETLVLTSWANDRDGMPFASRAFATCAKAAFRPKKAGLVMTLKVYHLAWLEHVVSDCVLYWEERKGRLSNSAGGNAHVVDGLKVLVKEVVERAIRIRNPEYDAEREAWIWGRHGLRISACGLEHMKPTAAAQSEEPEGDDDLSASVGDEYAEGRVRAFNIEARTVGGTGYPSVAKHRGNTVNQVFRLAPTAPQFAAPFTERDRCHGNVWTWKHPRGASVDI
ncbi:unnamed protein product [Closterium sp. Yama58-4]|nr:unnamed protein product [Closterium sp. Yama58-4]